MGKVVGILSQKGGEGKSTMIDFLATLIQTTYNPEKNKKKVLVVDSDYPQLSVYKLRTLEKSLLEKNSNEMQYYFNKIKYHYGIDNNPFMVVKKDLLDVPGFIESQKDNYDLILVDMAGTANTQGFNSSFLNLFDNIVIPTLVDYEDIVSNMDYINKYIIPLKLGAFSSKYLTAASKVKKDQYQLNELKQNLLKGLYVKYSNLKDFAVLFNKVENNLRGDLKTANDLKKELTKQNITTFNQVVFKRKKYSNLYITDSSKGIKSTIFPTSDAYINRFVEEFINFINL